MRSISWFLVHALLAACGSTAPTPTAPAPTPELGSRGPRAADHLQLAQEHARRAATLLRWLDSSGPRKLDVDRDRDLWFRTWKAASEDQHALAAHVDAASRLRAEFDDACATIPRADVARSPLAGVVLDDIATHDGVLLLLSTDAGPPDRLVATMRCHRAWLMLGESEPAMDRCPLDLEGLEFVAFGDRSGISIQLSVPDPILVPELQRRLHAHVLDHARPSVPAAAR